MPSDWTSGFSGAPGGEHRLGIARNLVAASTDAERQPAAKRRGRIHQADHHAHIGAESIEPLLHRGGCGNALFRGLPGAFQFSDGPAEKLTALLATRQAAGIPVLQSALHVTLRAPDALGKLIPGGHTLPPSTPPLRASDTSARLSFWASTG